MLRRLFTVVMIGIGLTAPGEAALASDSDISSAFSSSTAGSRAVVDHSSWGILLQRYVQVGPDGINRFDYAHVASEHRALLKTYIDHLQSIAPNTLSAAEQHAYWINFYNALTVSVILDHFPVKSIRDISPGLFSVGPWDEKLATVSGHRLSLSNIENDILRADWRDSRVHYALNCASLGCPNLSQIPYSGTALDGQLDAAARAFVNSSRAVDLRDNRLVLSKIYLWYAADFGGSDAAILAHLRKYAAAPLVRELSGVGSIDGYQYDWSLNAPRTIMSGR